MTHDFDDWFEWGLENKIHPDVLGYLAYSKEDLNTFSAKDIKNLITFATPRSWGYVSDLLHLPGYNKVPLAEVVAEISGRIGEGAAVKFLAHRKVAGTLPKTEDIMSGKVKELNNDIFEREMSAKYSLVVTLAHELHLKHDEEGVNIKEFNKVLNNVMRFIFNSIGSEMVVFFLKNVLKTNAEGESLFNLRTALDADLKKEFHSRYLQFLKNVPDQLS